MAPGAPPTSSSPRTTLRSRLARQFYGLGAHLDRLRQAADQPRLLICPSRGRYSGASMFRAYYLVDQMRRLGWRCTLLPVQMSWAQRERLIRSEKPGVIYLQQCRDPMTQPALYTPFAPTVLDIDDADFADPSKFERVDQAVRAATRVIAASDFLANWCRERNPNVDVLWTSHPPRKHEPPAHTTRRPVVAWVQIGWQVYQAEMEFVRTTVLHLAREQIAGLEFHLFDANDTVAAEEFVAPIRASGVKVQLIKRLPNEEFLRVLEQAAVGIHVLLPGATYAHGKSFGKVLSYIVAGAAIVINDPFETSRFFASDRNALASQTPEAMAHDIATLLRDPTRRQHLADSAYADFILKLSTPHAAQQLDAILRPLLARP